jgi:hypothetical protein
MTRRSKKSYAGGIAIESTYNTYVAPTTFLRYLKWGIKPNITDEDLDICDGVPGSKFMYRKQAELNGTLELPAWPEGGLEPLLKLIFGSATSTVNTATSYTHEFTQAWDSLLSASLTRWVPGMSSAYDVEAYTGAILSSLEIGYDGPGPISLKATFDAGGFDGGKTNPTRTYTTAAPFSWGQLAVELDQAAKTDVTKAAIKIERSVDKLFGADGSDGLIANILTPTDWAVTGSLQFPYETKAEFMTYLTGSPTGTSISTVITDRELQLTCTGPEIETGHDYLLDFQMPKVNVSKCDPDKDADKTVMYDIDFTAQYYDGVDNGLGTDRILGATVVSALAAIT